LAPLASELSGCENPAMTESRRLGRSREGVPEGDPVIEVIIRLYPGAGEDRDPSFPPRHGPFSGATIEWSYPEPWHERALDRIAVVRHAISVLLDDLEGSTTVERQ
jgi:hypothetical protein